ncbi:MAG: hypothetical protein IMY67_13045 [Bacteroidetes bacterium]|nr:hypothetical protein [Bacteroidota bacterium]
MIRENKVSKYMLYAIGEIILVVIGILIALQINNNNEIRKDRNKELHYLSNIKSDLQLNIKEIQDYMDIRSMRIASANIVIEHFEGKPLTDLDDFNRHIVNIYTWRKFYQINNTFQELTNSGNLALISNDTIKNTLLNIETHYKKLKYEEEHFRYDAEILLYEPSYKVLDLNPVVKKYTYQVSNGQAGEDIVLPRANFELMLKDLEQKNGFVMASYEFTFMNGQLEGMKSLCKTLIEMIDSEILAN